MFRSAAHDQNRCVRGTDREVFTPCRAVYLCGARLRQIRIGYNRTSRAGWLHRSHQRHSIGKGIFNPSASSREPRRPSVAFRQIGAHPQTALGRSYERCEVSITSSYGRLRTNTRQGQIHRRRSIRGSIQDVRVAKYCPWHQRRLRPCRIHRPCYCFRP